VNSGSFPQGFADPHLFDPDPIRIRIRNPGFPGYTCHGGHKLPRVIVVDGEGLVRAGGSAVDPAPVKHHLHITKKTYIYLSATELRTETENKGREQRQRTETETET
jgi:hypothetical protein